MCRVGDLVVVFGGTSPYNGPPLFFTQQQQELMLEHDTNNTSKLIDHNVRKQFTHSSSFPY